MSRRYRKHAVIGMSQQRSLAVAIEMCGCQMSSPWSHTFAPRDAILGLIGMLGTTPDAVNDLAKDASAVANEMLEDLAMLQIFEANNSYQRDLCHA